MNLLYISPTYYPAYYWGGPIFSTYGLCSALSQSPEVVLRVLTSDSAGPRFNDRLPTLLMPTTISPGFDVWYCRKWFGKEFAPGLFFRLYSMVRWAEVVHLTGVYSILTIPTLLLSALLGKPVVWSPRGALQRWDGSSRPLLKWLWEFACRKLMPSKGVVLHVTSDEEAWESLKRIPEAEATVIPNGVEIPELLSSREWVVDGMFRLLFIGRLDPKKGLENLFSALTSFDSAQLKLTVCGTGSEDYITALRDEVSRLGVGDQVCFVGHLDGVEKDKAFYSADVCIVPSHTENFGMVVAESLVHGVPVIVSKGAPWAEVEKHDCGLWVDNSPESLADAIRNMWSRDLPAMGKRGREWMVNDFSWDKMADKMTHVYRGLIRS